MSSFRTKLNIKLSYSEEPYSIYNFMMEEQLGSSNAIKNIKPYMAERLLHNYRLLNKCTVTEFMNEFWPQGAKSDEDLNIKLHAAWNLSSDDVIRIICILQGKLNKINTICFIGISNAGKTLLSRAITKYFIRGGIQRDSGVNLHWLSNIPFTNVICWDEPIVCADIKEDLKLVLAGEPIIINQKNKPLFFHEGKIPVIMTTNTAWWGGETVYENRMFILPFGKTLTTYVTNILTDTDIYNYLHWTVKNN